MKNIFFRRNPESKSVFKKGSVFTSGFTLIEILVVIGIIAILAAIVIVAINPARQFAQARNSQRQSNVEAILNAIGQRMADNQGLLNCPSATITSATSTIGFGTGVGPAITGSFLDLRSCLVPTYMSELPTDPTIGKFIDGANYNTGYTVSMDSTTGRITVAAPEASLASELSQTISLTR
jgi:type IV pilus assembly protein PilA